MGKDDFVYWPGGGGGGGGTGGGIDVQIGGNTSGTTALVSTGTLTMVGGNNVTLSQVGNAITFSVPNTASQSVQTQPIASATFQFWNPFVAGGITGNNQIGNGSVLFIPVQIGVNASATRANLFVSATATTSAASSQQGTMSFRLGLYSLSGSSLSLASSGSVTYTWNVTSNVSSDSISGLRMISLPINMNITPGDWWIGYWSSTATAGNNIFSISNGVVNAAKITASFQSASNATVQMAPGWGRYSVTSASLPTGAAINAILGGANIDDEPVFVNFMNLTG